MTKGPIRVRYQHESGPVPTGESSSGNSGESAEGNIAEIDRQSAVWALLSFWLLGAPARPLLEDANAT